MYQFHQYNRNVNASLHIDLLLPSYSETVVNDIMNSEYIITDIYSCNVIWLYFDVDGGDNDVFDITDDVSL